MLAKLRSGALAGIDAVGIDVEIDMSLGLPYFNVVGLPEGAVKESKVRVISALKNCGFDLPQKRITVNLAPADIRKEGAAFDLPIALGVLVAARLLDADAVAPYLIAGELSLDGAIKPIRGVLSLVVSARNAGFHRVLVPKGNAGEAALVKDVEVYAVETLRDAVDHLTDIAPLGCWKEAAPPLLGLAGPHLDMADVRGQHNLKDALELAAAGGHNVLMCGPPGSGKTMLAQRLPGILPRLSFGEALEVTQIHSVMGLVPEGGGLMMRRPFRAPHHTISDAGLIGGGPQGRPGELSLAHHGVLFLDELPEFRKNVLEVLRQPLEEGAVHIARANHHISFPTRVMLVAAMNPCPCGWYNVVGRICTCSERKVFDYHTRVSGPLLDRIDITVQTRPVDHESMVRLEADSRTSAWYRERVEAARARQRERFRDVQGVFCNAQMGPAELRAHCRMSVRAKQMIETAVQTHGLSARAHDRIIKLARTRADLEAHATIEDADVQLAIDCRMLDRRSWLVPSGWSSKLFRTRPAPAE